MHHGAAESDMRAVVERLGYVAPVTADHDAAERRREADLRRRWIVAVILGTPVVLLSMVPSLQFDGWEWVVAILATPIVFWCGWGFHRAAWMNLRHGSTTMDTLVSMGTLSAWTWSTVVLIGEHRRRLLRHGRHGLDVDDLRAAARTSTTRPAP